MVGLRGSLNPSAKLNEKQVMEIWRKLKEGRKKTHLAREYGVDAMVIHKISTGRNWGWLTGSLDLNVSEKTLDIP